MSGEGPVGDQSSPDDAASPEVRTDLDPELHALGEELARVLRSRGTRDPSAARSLRRVAASAASASEDDPEVHRILVDVAVAAEHLAATPRLRAYARSRRKVVTGAAASALIDGIVHQVEHVPDDGRPQVA